MTTATKATFEAVEQTFERLYRELREACGENAPDSYTWFAPTREALEGEYGHDIEREHDNAIGDIKAPVVAWIYECNGPTLATVHESATMDEIEDFLRSCMNLADDPYED